MSAAHAPECDGEHLTVGCPGCIAKRDAAEALWAAECDAADIVFHADGSIDWHPA